MLVRAFLLASRREHSLQCNDECEAQEGHHVVVGQITAGDGGAKRAHLHVLPGHGRRVYVSEPFLPAGPDVVRRTGVGVGEVGCGLSSVAMGGHFRLQQRDRLLAAGFTQVAQAQARTLSRLHGSATLEIRKGEVALAIAAVGGAQQREEGGILADGHELAIALRPARGSKIPGKNSDFGYKWIRHSNLFSLANFGWGKFPAVQ
jgi:hypothetical protein